MSYKFPKPKFYAQVHKPSAFLEKSSASHTMTTSFLSQAGVLKVCTLAGTIEVTHFCLGMIILHMWPTTLGGISLFREKKYLRPPRT